MFALLLSRDSSDWMDSADKGVSAKPPRLACQYGHTCVQIHRIASLAYLLTLAHACACTRVYTCAHIHSAGRLHVQGDGHKGVRPARERRKSIRFVVEEKKCVRFCDRRGFCEEEAEGVCVL
eukprot:1251722-Pleurochrysis_carterae.AAC.2